MKKKPAILGHYRAEKARDWGQWDPLEVLEHAKQEIGDSPDRNVDVLLVAWRDMNDADGRSVKWATYSLVDRDTIVGVLFRALQDIAGRGDGV